MRGKRSDRDGGLQAEIVFAGIPLAERLARETRVPDLERLATAGGEYGRESPAAQRPPDRAFLALVEGRTIDKERVVYELAVIELRPVHLVQIVGIVGRVAAG